MTTTPDTNQKIPLPYRYYLVSTFSFVLLGIVTTIYLSYSHYKNHTDITYSSFCAISSAINCDTVSQSSWSIFLGLPLSYWGLFGYLILLVLLCNSTKLNSNNRTIWSISLIISLFFSIVSIFLVYISATKIRSFCILCILTYGINFTLTVITWKVRNILSSTGNLYSVPKTFFSIVYEKRTLISFLTVLSLTIITVKTQIPQYWRYQYSIPSVEGISTGITQNGNPWIGSDDAQLVIDEYSDYQCFQCAKMHLLLRQLIKKHPDKIKLIHHHYPLDQEFNPIIVPYPFHIGAGKMALFAIHALYNGDFWKVNDALFELGKQGASFSTTTLAEKTGFTSGEFAAAITSTEYRKILDRDIKKGLKLRITSTPTFVINGQKYTGTIPTSVLEEIIQ